MTPLRIALVNVPLRSHADHDRWIAVPPEGYGGIQWVVAHIMHGLLELGHQVFLLGAPGSPVTHRRMTVVPAGEPDEISAWLRDAQVDVVHDHSDGRIGAADVAPGVSLVSTHHLTGRPANPRHCVYLSRAQRAHCGAAADAPVIPIPIDPSHYMFARQKEDFLLFLGRVSPHKGALEAAAFAEACGLRLVMAGPSWEPEYLAEIRRRHPRAVDYIGEVGGQRRRELLARARAVTVLSQATTGPWGGTWCEPGATVVSEAAASGTPVVATRNGCLVEIVPPVGAFVPYGTDFDPAQAQRCLSALPAPATVRAEAVGRWGHVGIAARYDEVFRSVTAAEADAGRRDRDRCSSVRQGRGSGRSAATAGPMNTST